MAQRWRLLADLAVDVEVGNDPLVQQVHIVRDPVGIVEIPIHEVVLRLFQVVLKKVDLVLKMVFLVVPVCRW